MVLSACGDGDEPGGLPDATPHDAASDEGAPLDSGSADDAAPDAVVVPPPPTHLGSEDRPARIVIPSAHDGTTPLPLVILLHGYTSSSAVQDGYFGTSLAAEARGFYLILPEGTVDSRGNPFWNATDACCDFEGAGVDDVAYLTSLLDEAESLLPVDTGRVYFIGHSNGGFMSYRMACELSDRITAIASLAGSDYKRDGQCTPSAAVSVLQIHGTADPTIAYGGHMAYPSAVQVIERWAGRGGCDLDTVTGLEPIDLETVIAGPETTRDRWQTGCDAGLDAELWTITGGAHVPAFDPSVYGELVTDWLLTHVK